MAKLPGKDLNLQASILDRLVDHDPKVSHEPVQFRLLNINDIKNAVIRDLEHLLNTRRTIWEPEADQKSLRESIYTFGLKDFTSSNPKNPAIKQRLRYDIEQSISRFEPRLKNVSVNIDSSGSNERSLRFRISGLLIAEPLTEPVTFDTYFDVNRGEYVIQK